MELLDYLGTIQYEQDIVKGQSRLWPKAFELCPASRSEKYSAYAVDGDWPWDSSRASP